MLTLLEVILCVPTDGNIFHTTEIYVVFFHCILVIFYNILHGPFLQLPSISIFHSMPHVQFWQYPALPISTVPYKEFSECAELVCLTVTLHFQFSELPYIAIF